MNKQEISSKIRELAIIAGEAIMEVYQSDDFAVETKDDDSPVTIADRRADQIIYDGLSKTFEIPIVTEEKAETHDVSADTFFIVDPLDGTKEFVHRRGDFTVNIALVENGVPTMGVVYAPAKDRLFLTLGDGTVVEEAGEFDPSTPGKQVKIHVSSTIADQLSVVASKSHRDAATDEYIAKYNVGDFKAAGSSLKFCLIATGEAELYPRLGRTMEWDTAAGDAIVRAAGGQVVRFDDHSPLAYGKPGFKNPFFIVSAHGVELKEA